MNKKESKLFEIMLYIKDKPEYVAQIENDLVGFAVSKALFGYDSLMFKNANNITKIEIRELP